MLNKDNRKLKAAIKRMNAARSIVDYNAKVKMIRYVAVRNTDIKTVINALLESEKGKCNWILQYGGYHSLKYEGTCGIQQWIYDSSLQDSDFDFCPKCRGQVVEWS